MKTGSEDQGGAAQTLAESVATDVRRAIAAGRHLPGERLVELSIASSMAVSQNTVRDALRILEQEGWVVKRARRGVYVRAFTPDEADEVYVLLSALSQVTLDAAMTNLTRSGVVRLRHLLEGARQAAHTLEPEAATEALFRFHETLSQAANRLLATEFTTRLINYARLIDVVRQAQAPISLEQLEARIAAHERLLDLIAARDPSAHAVLRDLLDGYRGAPIPALKD